MNDWSKAEEHAERARHFYQAGQWEKALAELQAALAVNPQQGDWHFGMGLTLDALQRFDEAISSFEKALELRGDDVETMLYLAVDLLRAGQGARAVEVLERVNKIDPEYEAGYCYRIAAHALLGDHEAAETCFYLARQISQECPVCFDHLAQSLLTRGMYDRALWCWQQVLRLDARYPAVHQHLARLHRRADRAERAIQEYQLHLRNEPGDSAVRLEYAQMLMDEDRLAEAGEQLHRVLESEPAQATAILHLGELALINGHLDTAQRQLDKARKIAADLPGLGVRQAELLIRQKRPDAARQVALAEAEKKGLSPAQAIDLARILLDLRTPAPVEGLLLPYLAEAEEQALPPIMRAAMHRALGDAEMLSGRTRQGLAQYHLSYHLQPTDRAVLRLLVLAHLHGREWQRAQVWLRKARKLEPGRREWRRLGRRLWWARVKFRISNFGFRRR